jgi:hypothetical protein
MDPSRKRELKKLGKAEVARRSAVLRAAMKDANPAALSDPSWEQNYKLGLSREKWLREKLPLLRREQVETMFVVHPNGGAGWRPHVGGYALCERCGCASPTAIPKRLFYWRSCACGNIKWRCVGPWRRVTVAHPELMHPVKLIGKG